MCPEARGNVSLETHMDVLSPTMMTGRLIGRDADLQRVLGLLDAGARVVTLWGPAGVGKTRLARACIEPASALGFGAVWFCDLTSATTTAGVASVVSDALDVRVETIEQLGRALGARGRALVILDNVEQVVGDAATLTAAWLASATDASFLVTSRETLRLGDEIVYEVAPLPVTEAGELFVDRMRAAGRQSQPGDAKLVDAIVQRLDGLPLAVELAAAQAQFLGLSELLARLPQLAILDGDRRDVGERQRTLRGALDWSWRLLPTNEQAALAQCAVFRGGFTLAAAEAVLDVGTPALNVLRALYRRSLVQTRELGYTLLVEVREYAAEHLAARSDAKATRDRHAAYFAAGTSATAFEQENLLEAHRHARSTDPVLAARIALVLEPLLLARGPFELLRQLFDDVDQAALDDRLLALVLHGRALAHRRLGDSDAAFADFDRALGIVKRSEDRALEASLLCERGRWLAEQSQCAAAIPLLEEALALARRTGDRLIESEALTNLGQAMWYDGKLVAAEGFYHRAAPLARAEKNRALEGRILANIGLLAFERGDLAPFFEAVSAARQLVRDAGDQRYAAVLTMDLALGLEEAGRSDEADRLMEEALVALREAGDVVGEGHCTANLGWIDQMRRGAGAGRAHFERALMLLDGAGIGWADGLVRASLAAVAATHDRVEEARVWIAEAEREMASVGDPRLHDAARLHYSHLELALARRDEVTGDHAKAASRRETVMALIAREPTDPDSNRTGTRCARALVERALAGGTLEDERPSDRSIATAPPLDALLVARDAIRFRPPNGQWVDLSRRKPLRRVLAALVATTTELATDDLLRAGWPGEHVSPQAGSARVHVAIATLRRLGLGGLLRHNADGYVLDRESVPIATDVDAVIEVRVS